MGDVGIGLLKPQYPEELLVPEDTAYWEVLYSDGTVLCEAQGAKYPQIDRARLASFRLIHNGTIVFEIGPWNGKTGRDLVYRRRTTITQEGGGRSVVFIVGFAPDAFFTVDIANGRYFESPDVVPSLQHMPGEPPDLLPHWTL